MNRGRAIITNQTLLWGSLFLLAALARLVSLGWPPLGESEAASALSAATGRLASPFWTGGAGTLGSASYQSLTGWLFQALGTGDAVARWIPALAGLGLIFLSRLWRRRLGRGRALLLGLLLALSPTMLTTSRTAGDTSLALLGLGIFVTFALLSPETGSERRHFAWMGAGLGLALASGPTAWDGLLSLAVALAWLRWRGGGSIRSDQVLPRAWRVLALALAVTFVGIATQFGASMGGLGVALQSPAQWLAGWTRPGDLTLLTAMVLLPVYEPLILVFGVLGAARPPTDDPVWRGARIWTLAAVALFLLRVGRTPEDLVWVVLPLAVLATLPLGSLVEVLTDGMEDVSVYLMTAVLAALAGFTYLQVAGYVNEVDIGGSPELVTLGLVLTAIGFAASLFLLYGMTWSWTEAFHALGSTGAVVLALVTLSAGWRLAFSPRATGGPELWRPTSASPDVRLLEDTLVQLAMADRGEEAGLPIRVQAPVPAVLAWALRHETSASLATSGGSPPQAILLPDSDTPPSLPGTYLGQRFGVDAAWGWDGPLPPDGLGWWILRKGGMRSIEWVLYVHSDQPVQTQGQK